MIQYLAGVFDSEGYVRIRKTMNGKNYSYTYECRLYMTNSKIVKLFAKKYGLTMKSDERGKHRKIAYYVTLNSKQLRETTFISDLLPFLNEKREQLLQVKKLIEGVDKEVCYRAYMNAKLDFTHPVIGKPGPEYLAGIIDGDGWLSMFNANKGTALYNKFSVGLQQRYKPMIEYMTRFGGSNVHTCKVYDKQSHVQTYSWQATTSSILPFLESIYPFLIEKKEKCLILMNCIQVYEEFRDRSEELLQLWQEK